MSIADPGAIRSESWIRSKGSFIWDVEAERLLNLYLSGGFTFDTMTEFSPTSYHAPRPFRGSLLDSDGDGIPDVFDPKPDVFSAWDDTNGDGWTDLESYLNFIDRSVCGARLATRPGERAAGEPARRRGYTGRTLKSIRIAVHHGSEEAGITSPGRRVERLPLARYTGIGSRSQTPVISQTRKWPSAAAQAAMDPSGEQETP